MIKFEEVNNSKDLVLGATYSDVSVFCKMTEFLVFEGIQGERLVFSESPLNKRESGYLKTKEGKINFFDSGAPWHKVSDEQMSEIASQKI